MRYLLPLLLIGIATYAVIDCVRTEDDRVRLGLPVWVWVVFILMTFGVGGLVWLVVSRINRDTPPERPARRRSGPLAPDDDPEFLAELERRARRTAAPPPPPADDLIVPDDLGVPDGVAPDGVEEDGPPPDPADGSAPGPRPPDRV